MPYKEKVSFKLYYSIGEVSDLLGVNQSLLRFWEKEFDIIKPQKNPRGNRIYTAKDLENLKLIHHLVKENGYTLEGAKKKMKLDKEGLHESSEIIERLKNIKETLLEIKQAL